MLCYDVSRIGSLTHTRTIRELAIPATTRQGGDSLINDFVAALAILLVISGPMIWWKRK